MALRNALVLIPCCKKKGEGGSATWEADDSAALLLGPWGDALMAARRELAELLGEAPGFDFGGEITPPPLMRAEERYTGRLYGASGLGRWDEGTRAVFRRSTLIVSGLYGLVRPQEAIRYYQCAMNARLPTGEQVADWWRRRGLGEWLRAYVDLAGIRTVYCFLPNLYVKAIDGLDFGESELHHIACDPGSGSMAIQGRRLRDLFLEGRCTCSMCSAKGTGTAAARVDRLQSPKRSGPASLVCKPGPVAPYHGAVSAGGRVSPSSVTAGVARALTEAFMAHRFDLSARRERATAGWRGMPEVAAAERVRQAGASDAQVRLFLTFTAAMDRARDAGCLWSAAGDLFVVEPWVFDPTRVGERVDVVPELLRKWGVSQRHGPDAQAWVALAQGLLREQDLPRTCDAVFRGKGDAQELLRERTKSGADGRPLLPMIRGPKVGPMWVRMLAYPGGATLSSLAAIRVAVDVHVRRASENLGVVATKGMNLEDARPLIQEAWASDVAACGAAGPDGLRDTCAAVDPALWFFGKYGCSFCEREGRRVPIADVCDACVAVFSA